MGVNNFGINSNSSSIFSRIQPYPLPDQRRSLSGNQLPVVRSGITTYFNFTNVSTIELKDSSTNATIATILAGTYIAGGSFRCHHLSSSDNCLYSIVVDTTSANARLIKINDTTGGVTAIGPAFATTTPLNWGTDDILYSLFVDRIGNTLRVHYPSYFHDIDIITGLPITQDNLISTGYSIGVNYVSSNGLLYSTGLIGLTNKASLITYETSITSPAMYVADIGIIPSLNLEHRDVFGLGVHTGVARFGATSTQGVFPIISIDTDKIAFCIARNSSYDMPIRVVLRASYDNFLQSVANYWAGIQQ